MKDSQKKGRGSSGGQKIDDHAFWAGRSSPGSVFPDGPHKLKMESSAEGAGSEMDYEDTTEKVKAQQMESVKQIKKNPMKPLYRN